MVGGRLMYNLIAGYSGAHLPCTSHITLFIPGCKGRLCYIPIL